MEDKLELFAEYLKTLSSSACHSVFVASDYLDEEDTEENEYNLHYYQGFEHGVERCYSFFFNLFKEEFKK